MIKDACGGIEISDNSSSATISIALLLADKVMNHQPFIISGSDDFKKSVINAAIYDDLPVYFADLLIQSLFLHQKELMDNEGNYFIYNGGTQVTNRLNPKPFITPFNRQTIETVANIRLRLPTLSQLPLVHSESQGTDLLERKKLAELTSLQILERISENMEKLSAKSHVEYINCENAFSKRGGCIFHSHHLPKWAKKIFSVPLINMKVAAIVAMLKLNLYSPMNLLSLSNIAKLSTLLLINISKTITILTPFTINLALYPTDKFILCFPNALSMRSKKLKNVVRKIFSNIRLERKKMLVNRLLMKSLIAELQNRANGATIFFYSILRADFA